MKKMDTMVKRRKKPSVLTSFPEKGKILMTFKIEDRYYKLDFHNKTYVVIQVGNEVTSVETGPLSDEFVYTNRFGQYSISVQTFNTILKTAGDILKL